MRFRLPYTLKRFQKWNLLKTHPFENAPFLVGIGENGGFENGAEKSVIFCLFTQCSCVLVLTVVQNLSKIVFLNENARGWKGKTKTKTLACRKCFASFWLRRKRILANLKNALLWREPWLFTRKLGIF